MMCMNCKVLRNHDSFFSFQGFVRGELHWEIFYVRWWRGANQTFQYCKYIWNINVLSKEPQSSVISFVCLTLMFDVGSILAFSIFFRTNMRQVTALGPKLIHLHLSPRGMICTMPFEWKWQLSIFFFGGGGGGEEVNCKSEVLAKNGNFSFSTGVAGDWGGRRRRDTHFWYMVLIKT